jgi:hypothetical protein
MMTDRQPATTRSGQHKGIAMSNLDAPTETLNRKLAETHERRARREAARCGLRLKKLRDGDGYWLIDNDTNCLVMGHEITRGVRIGYGLDVIEEYLNAERTRN